LPETERFLLKFLEKRIDQSWYTQNLQTDRGKFQFEIMKRIILNYLPPKDSLILDVGIDPAIFSKLLAEKERRVIVADISYEQLRITRKRLEEENLDKQIEQYAVLESFTDLRQFQDASFDMVLSLYCTLSFTCDKKKKMLAELVRVCKPGAPIIFTVKNKINYLRTAFLDANIEKLTNPVKAGFWEFLDTNYKPFEDFPGEPTYYAFTAEEIESLLEECACEVLEVRGVNCLFPYPTESLAVALENEDVMNTLLEMEERISNTPGLRDAGVELVVIARKVFL